MTADELLSQVEHAGCHVMTRNNSLLINGALPDELRHALREHKAEIITLLQGKQKVAVVEAVRLLDTQGWAPVKSKALGGEVVLFVRDDKVAIPVRWQKVVPYTKDELQQLTNGTMDTNGLRQVHQAKKMFNGKITSALQDEVEIHV